MTQWALRYIYEGGVQEANFLDENTALDEAFSRLRNGAGTPLHIRCGDDVRFNYFDILKRYKAQ